MDSERSRSAAVLCRSRWKRDAEERGVWSRTRFASRKRERTRALRDAAALIPVATEGTRRIPDGWKAPKLMDSERSRSAAVLCRSGWKWDAKEHDVWSRNGVRESRAREDSSTPRRCRAPPRSRRGNEADPRTGGKPPNRWTPQVPECGSPLPLWLETGCERTRRLVPQRGPGVESARGLAHSKTLPRSSWTG